jgi:hypothetical protein
MVGRGLPQGMKPGRASRVTRYSDRFARNLRSFPGIRFRERRELE